MTVRLSKHEGAGCAGNAARPSLDLGSATPAESPAEPYEFKETPTETRAGARGRVVAPAFRPSEEALAAYVDLHRALLRATTSGQPIPCQGEDSEAWTSGGVAEQQLAAERCLACPALVLCKRYADLAEEPLGTWGGVTRTPAPGARVVPVGGRWCACGCDEVTKGGRYRPGHDSRHLARLVWSARGGAISPEDAFGALADSPSLQAKLVQRLRK